LIKLARRKLEKTAEFKSFENTLENPEGITGKWSKEIFKNKNPITLELGCGKGDYSLNLAEKFPDKNFIGVDVKSARLWKGAKIALENKFSNVVFLRIQIENIKEYFGKGEVEEIWITFPDPQPKKRSAKRTANRGI